jgi:hypothetical protein
VGLNAEVEADGAVLDYGDYESPTLADSTKGATGLEHLRYGALFGESPLQISTRADRITLRLTTLDET